MSEKKQFTLRLSPALAEMIDEFKELYEQNTGDILNTDRKIFEAILDTAQSKYAPFRDNSKELAKLQAENTQLKQQLDSLSAGKNQLDQTTAQLQSQIKQLQAENAELKDKLAKVLISKADLNKVASSLIGRYLKDKKTTQLFERYNRNGHYNGFFDTLDAQTDTENTKRLLLGAFLLSAMGKPLPAVVSNARIKKAIDNQVKNFDL